MSALSPRVRRAATQAGRRKSNWETASSTDGSSEAATGVLNSPPKPQQQVLHPSSKIPLEAKTDGVVTNQSASAARRRSSDRRRLSASKSADYVDPRRKVRRQFYTVHFRKAEFEIDVRYQNCKYLRSGAYGRVCSAIDSVDGSTVAIKKVPNMFEDLVDAKRILREIKLLLHFKKCGGHQNIVLLRDIMCGSRSSRSFEDCYIVLDAYECDLSTIISRDHTQLGKAHVQYLTYQILAGLKFMHTAGVIHRDLKPANLLVRSNCDLVICDFGLSRGGANDRDVAKTAYVVTRYYRAPELLCRLNKYDAGVDIWSTALIVAEMLTGEVVLRGSSTIDQLRKTLDFVPPPDEQFQANIPAAAARIIREHPKHKASHFKRILRKRFLRRGGSKAVDFLEATLVFDPDKRLTVQEALEHRYLKKIRSDLVSEERGCDEIFDESFEKDYPLDIEMPKRMIQDQLYDIMEELTLDPGEEAAASANTVQVAEMPSRRPSASAAEPRHAGTTGSATSGSDREGAGSVPASQPDERLSSGKKPKTPRTSVGASMIGGAYQPDAGMVIPAVEGSSPALPQPAQSTSPGDNGARNARASSEFDFDSREETGAIFACLQPLITPDWL
eukprot:INCI3650.7.p1 GENE.INCI3650.7~~INCI3650.7.p1  ORF type:complete len:635 (+),score=120.26 INCI3650.7:62-1906(+)